MGNLYLRAAIAEEIARLEREYPEPQDEDIHAWVYGRVSGLHLVLTWLDRMDAGYRPTSGPEDLHPGTP